MLAITHLIVSLLLINLMMLDRNDAFVALLFGVFIDVDHLFGLRQYVGVHGVGAVLDFDMLMNADGQWKSMLHSPVAAMVVGPVASASRMAIPLIFWGFHISMDYAEDAVLGLFSLSELALLGASSCALVFLTFRSYRMRDPEIGLSGYLMQVWSRLIDPLRALPGALSRALGR